MAHKTPFLPYFLALFLVFLVGVGVYLGYKKNLSHEALSVQKTSHLLAPSQPHPMVVFPNNSAQIPHLPSVERWGAQRYRYHQVPRVYTKKVPLDLRSLKGFRAQRAFIHIMLPLVLAENERILSCRRQVLFLLKKQEKATLTQKEQQFLAAVAMHYKVSNADPSQLLRRIDVIPPSLAIAQAIFETGFGTSPAAIQKNALFGHMIDLHRVASYRTLSQSVASYMHNLNSHRAYKHLREIRHQKRNKGFSASGYLLAQGLEKYSIRGKVYIDGVQRIIRCFHLGFLDFSTLSPLPKKQYAVNEKKGFSQTFVHRANAFQEVLYPKKVNGR